MKQVLSDYFFSFSFLFFIIKKQLSGNNRIFAYGIISILIISCTSYPLHLIPIIIVLVVLMSLRENSDRGVIPCKFTVIDVIIYVHFYDITIT